MYAVYTLDDVFEQLRLCSTLFPVHEWLSTLKVIDKLPSWQMRKKALGKVLPILERIRSAKLDLKDWRKAYRLFHTLADWYLMAHNDPPISQYSSERVQQLEQHFARPETRKLPVIITMTSCKRLDLLMRTLDSMLENCLDLTEYVREWIIIDDNSSAEDRSKMKALYPFARFIDKTPSDKGHPRSMNLLHKYLVNTNCQYNFHIEDDFEWWFPDRYLTKLMKVIAQDPSFGQAAINFEYTEDTHQGREVWSRDMHYIDGLRYFVHEYYTGERLQIESNHLGALSSMYWPHFTFRPALTNVQVIKKLGGYNEAAQHFEMEYANHYAAKGFKTAMLDCCYTTHIGRRTYERNSDKRNAYDLNQEQQFGEKPKPSEVAKASTTEACSKQNGVALNPQDITRIRTFVINLKRRPERLLQFVKRNNGECPSFEVFEGVDGKALEPSLKIHKIFETSDYNYRRGIVGCAYSHLKIWQAFLKGKTQYCVVLEDDVQLTCNFREKLLHLLQSYRNEFDILFLHWNPYHHVPNQNDLSLQFAKPRAELWSMERSIRDNMGSGAGYVMTREGAKHMLEWVNKHGMPNAVDWNLFKQPELRIMYSKPMLVFGQCWQNNTQVDSDIQKEYDCVKFASEEAVVEHEIKRWLRELQPNNTRFGVAKHRVKKDSKLDFLESYPESLVCITDDSKAYQELSWDEQQQRIFVVPQSVEVETSKPVKWYSIGPYKVIVPDLMISKQMYEDTVWFDNRINFAKV